MGGGGRSQMYHKNFAQTKKVKSSQGRIANAGRKEITNDGSSTALFNFVFHPASLGLICQSPVKKRVRKIASHNSF